uniref:Uncharacterized protein n=1 Tax=Amphora coffeiformis TaxID=265554 RepID=A0A7S3P830_9STRA|eukprot:scaffold10030_cov285-Amphora_coffeaeformis.AAC.4
MAPFEWPGLTSLDMDLSFVSDNARSHQKKRQPNPRVFRRSASLPEDGARNLRRVPSRPARRGHRRRSSIDVVESVDDSITCRWHNIKISARNDVPPVLKRRNPETTPPGLKRKLEGPAITISSANFKQGQASSAATTVLNSPMSWETITNTTTTTGSSSLSVLKQVLEHIEQQNIFLENPEESQDDCVDDDTDMTVLSTDEDTSSFSTSSFESESKR